MFRVLLLHLVVTAFLCGLIWVVQVVHYPLFDRVDRTGFAAFEAEHSRRITWVVGPAMLLELFTGAWLLVGALRGTAPLEPGIAIANLGLIALIWMSTMLVQVPAHTTLADGFDAQAHRILVASNWIRTVLWTARTVGLFALVARAAGR